LDTTPGAAPTLVSPVNSASVNDIPDLLWNTVPDTSEYEIQVDDNSDFSSTLYSTRTSLTAFTPTTLNSGIYYWRVRGIDAAGNLGAWSAVWSFTLTFVGPSPPSLSSPSDGVFLLVSPTLSWSTVSGATEYQVQVSDSDDFSTIVSDTVVTTPTNVLTGLLDGSHHWRVRSINATGSGAWSSIWLFTIDTTPPSAPSLSLPSDGSTTNNAAITFEWGADPDAIRYHVQVSTDSTFGSTQMNVTSFTNSFTPSSPLSDGTHYWRVRSIDAAGNIGVWATAWSLLIDTTGPIAPVLSAPADGSVVTTVSVTLSWIGSSDSVLFMIQVSVASDFSSLKVDDQSTSASYLTSALDTGIYYWRVKGVDIAGNEGTWSTAWSFAISVSSTPPPTSDPTSAPPETSEPETSSSPTPPDPGEGFLLAPHIFVVISTLGLLITITQQRRKSSWKN
jgi:hypothetical protein